MGQVPWSDTKIRKQQGTLSLNCLHLFMKLDIIGFSLLYTNGMKLRSGPTSRRLQRSPGATHRRGPSHGEAAQCSKQHLQSDGQLLAARSGQEAQIQRLGRLLGSPSRASDAPALCGSERGARPGTGCAVASRCRLSQLGGRRSVPATIAVRLPWRSSFLPMNSVHLTDQWCCGFLISLLSKSRLIFIPLSLQRAVHSQMVRLRILIPQPHLPMNPNSFRYQIYYANSSKSVELHTFQWHFYIATIQSLRSIFSKICVNLRWKETT